MATSFDNLNSEQLETLAFYTEIIIAKSDNHKAYKQAKDESLRDLVNDVIIAQRAQQAAIEALALRLWNIDLWALWCAAPDDFIGECERKLHGKNHS